MRKVASKLGVSQSAVRHALGGFKNMSNMSQGGTAEISVTDIAEAENSLLHQVVQEEPGEHELGKQRGHLDKPKQKNKQLNHLH